MLSTTQKIKYFLNSALRYFEEVRCTYCGNTNCYEIDRKYFFTRLYGCSNCHLYFRFPVEKDDQNKKFYQSEYIEKDKITTDLPSMEELQNLMSNRFIDGNKNADRYIRLFNSLSLDSKKSKVVDYGCSWGYTSWQIKNAGFDVQSFEISVPRAEFGKRNLQLDILTSEDGIIRGNDIFFSSHVIEHHPNLQAMFKLGKSVLSNGGFFIAVCPNGSDAYRINHQLNFHLCWGKVHPNYLNAEFYKKVFENNPYYIGTSPINFDNINLENINKQYIDDLSGEELIIIAKINSQLAMP